MEATASWPWVTKGFEQIGRGLRDRASTTRRESSDPGRVEGGAREDIERVGLFGQSASLEERIPSHTRARGSFGHPEGYARRPRFGNPGGVGTVNASTVKSLAELIGLEMVDAEIHSALSWIMSGLLGPLRQ